MRFSRRIKRITALLCALALLLLAGCQSSKTEEKIEDTLETKYITTTFYPLYALAVNIVKDVPALSLSCLTQPQDGCIRSYSLSEWDYSILLNQDAVILGGRGLESFESALSQLTNQPILLSVLEGAHLREEDVGDSDDENTAHFIGENPWSFMSVAGAMEICVAIAGDMATIDESFTETYHENLTAYIARLESLISEMSALIALAPNPPVAVLHEGLTYFCEQFSLNIACIYPREPGSDAVDNDLDALLLALKESGAKVVFIEEQAPSHLVNALEEAGYSVARLDTLTAHMADGDTGTYERVMLENAQKAQAALMQSNQRS